VRIIEVFHSFQGEGPFTGFRTSFVRTARCNLRCAWCDTPYSFGPGVERSIGSLLEEVGTHGTRHLCLTGGEPLLQREAPAFVRAAHERKLKVVIETGGSLDVTPYLEVPGVVLSVDVKGPSSKMERRNRWENLPMLRRQDVLKFVIGDRADYDHARSVLAKRPSRAQRVFQPVWGSDVAQLAQWVLDDRLDVRLLLQEHKQIWGDVPGR
jgi:7-carboxy-7-deazaguanine synthase